MLDSNKATEVLKYSNKVFRTIWAPSVPDLSFGHLPPANQTFSVSHVRRTLNAHAVAALLLFLFVLSGLMLCSGAKRAVGSLQKRCAGERIPSVPRGFCG